MALTVKFAKTNTKTNKPNFNHKIHHQYKYRNKIEPRGGTILGLMDRMANNFHKDQTGIHNWRNSKIVNVIGSSSFLSSFYDYLCQIDAFNRFFCYRWLLILFHQEFTTNQIQILGRPYGPIEATNDIFVVEKQQQNLKRMLMVETQIIIVTN